MTVNRPFLSQLSSCQYDFRGCVKNGVPPHGAAEVKSNAKNKMKMAYMDSY